MDQKTMKGILRKVKRKKGCKSTDFVDLIPTSFFGTDPPTGDDYLTDTD